MPSVYRRLRRTAARASIALCALVLPACGGAGEDSPRREVPAPRPKPFALSALLASRSFELIDVDPASGRALVRVSDGSELLWFAELRRPLALPGGIGFESLALLPGGEERLARQVATLADDRGRLFRFGPEGHADPLPIALAGARLVGRRADDGALGLAGITDSGAEAVYSLSAATRLAERVAEFPSGFSVSVLSEDGGSIALRRMLHPDAHELYLLRRASGETRLLLPSGEDARFRPLAFDRAAASLLLLTDERSDLSRLEWLDLDSGERRPLPSPVGRVEGAREACDVVDGALSADGRRIAATAVCAGRRELRLLDANSGEEAQLPLLPALGRAVAGTLGIDGELAFVTIASPRTPRDLVAYGAGTTDPLPLTWGLAPGIDPALLIEPSLVRLVTAGGIELPVELWLPAGPPDESGSTAGTGALLWIEGDHAPPAWGELEPFFQFLAGRGVAVARFRLRGSDGFGRLFRHAADGRPLEAAAEDLATVRREIARRRGEPLRLAIVGDGAWPGAVAATLAYFPESLSAPWPAAMAAVAADPDPLRRLDELATLSEPAKGWWTARLGAPDSRAAVAARAATRADMRLGVTPTLPLLDAARLDRAALWQFLAPHLEPRGAPR